MRLSFLEKTAPRDAAANFVFMTMILFQLNLHRHHGLAAGVAGTMPLLGRLDALSTR